MGRLQADRPATDEQEVSRERGPVALDPLVLSVVTQCHRFSCAIAHLNCSMSRGDGMPSVPMQRLREATVTLRVRCADAHSLEVSRFRADAFAAPAAPA